MKCGYDKCKLGNQVSKEEAIKYKDKYYHSACHDKVLNKVEIRKLFYENINPSEDVKKVNIIISQLIDQLQVDSNYIVFALKYIIDNNLKLNYIHGLKFWLGNKEIRAAWDTKVKQDHKQKMYNKEIEIKDTEIIFDYKPSKKGWNSILSR